MFQNGYTDVHNIISLYSILFKNIIHAEFLIKILYKLRSLNFNVK
jgi:hypothetical protein